MAAHPTLPVSLKRRRLTNPDRNHTKPLGKVTLRNVKQSNVKWHKVPVSKLNAIEMTYSMNHLNTNQNQFKQTIAQRVPLTLNLLQVHHGRRGEPHLNRSGVPVWSVLLDQDRSRSQVVLVLGVRLHSRISLGCAGGPLRGRAEQTEREGLAEGTSGLHGERRLSGRAPPASVILL